MFRRQIFTLVSVVLIAVNFCWAEEDKAKNSEPEKKSKSEKVRELVKSGDVRIDFYGSVVDQNNEPVEDAKVIVNIVYYNPLASWSFGMKDVTLTTDKKGRFELRNEKGHEIMIGDITKKGYEFTYISNPKTSFGYSAISSHPIISPDPSNPVIFTMRKKEPATLVIPFEFGFGVGTEKKFEEKEVDLVQGQSYRPGYLAKYSKSSHIDLLVKAEITEDKTNYRITFTTPDADSGITEKEVLLYMVPENGYESIKTITLPVESESQKHLYVKSRQGGVYARLDLKIKATKGGFSVNIKSWANPTGSRNVDYDPDMFSKELDRRMEEDKRKAIEREERKKLKQQK